MRAWTFGDLRTLRRMAPVASASVIAGELGRTPGAVRARASIHGIRLMKRGALRHVTGCPCPPEVRAAVLAAWAAGGVTRQDLAKRYDVAWNTVNRWVGE